MTKRIYRKNRTLPLTVEQHDIIRSNWDAYATSKITISEIADHAQCSYETVRRTLAKIAITKGRQDINTAILMADRYKQDRKNASTLKPEGIRSQPFTEEWYYENQVNAERHLWMVWDEMGR